MFNQNMMKILDDFGLEETKNNEKVKNACSHPEQYSRFADFWDILDNFDLDTESKYDSEGTYRDSEMMLFYERVRNLWKFIFPKYDFDERDDSCDPLYDPNG